MIQNKNLRLSVQSVDKKSLISERAVLSGLASQRETKSVFICGQKSVVIGS